MIIEKNNQYALECQIKISAECVKASDFCDSEEEAQDWVENKFWIDSGEGWICTKCHEQILKNLANIKPRHER